jgi:hypothetical protein
MAEQRQTTINLDAVQMTKIREIVGPAAFNAAIGYLATWNMTFPQCQVYADRELPDLVACYFDEAGTCRYAIGAIWHGEHYGFHS